MSYRSDAIVIGAGPAGTSAAIWLATAGWTVTLLEQHAFPRQKVCGECVSAGVMPLLDDLGVGRAFLDSASPELKQVGWMHGESIVIANLPPCQTGSARYGRALGRDQLDATLLARAGAVGVRILQPVRARHVSGAPGNFFCQIEPQAGSGAQKTISKPATITASIIIDAHGSWESGARFEDVGQTDPARQPKPSDLFAFKARFVGSSLSPGLLPVLAVRGGYGGMVVSDKGQTTLALCLRRDAMRAIRVGHPGTSVGAAVEAYLRLSCRGVRAALHGAERAAPWLTVGPLRPGTRLGETPGIFRVGNAAGETHPLIGEGISMALQSSSLMVDSLLSHADGSLQQDALARAHVSYANAWREAFLPRMRLAALFAHVAMRAPLSAPVGAGLTLWPQLLSTAARFAGKARPAVKSHFLQEEPL